MTSSNDQRANIDQVIDTILAGARRIAVVGLSDQPWRTSHRVSRAMQGRGYEIIPVNPEIHESLGVPAVASLADLEAPVDLVNVFRRSEHLPGIATEAAAIGAPALWNQLGLHSPRAAAIAAEAGMDYVEDRCIMVEAGRRDAHPRSSLEG